MKDTRAREPSDVAEKATAVSAERPTAFAQTTPSSPEAIHALASGSKSAAETIVPPAWLKDPGLSAESDRYESGEMLGKGGMGEVRVLRDQWIGRDVALKNLLPDFAATPGARERFLREIRVQGQLEHPSIVPVYDVGQTSAGELYFTMRRVRGLTLAEILAGLRDRKPELERRFSRRKLLTAFSQICMVMHYAHARGVVHRDLKPSNVMFGSYGEVYVLDWGIAKLIDASDGDELVDGPISTGAGRLIGTLAYMSPEQACGMEVDGKTDVYSLGVILFEILALEPLLADNQPARLIKLVREGVDARPTTRARGEDVPPELEAICVKATAKETAERFASAKELSEAVERYLDGDRDLERRRALAGELAARASELLPEITAAATPAERAEAARTEAFHTVLHALALDPDHAAARGTLGRLLIEPPRAMPAAAERERAKMHEAERVEGAKLGYRAYASFTLAFPLIFAAGVKNWALVVAGFATIVASALYARHMYVAKKVGPAQFATMLTLSCIVVLIQGTWLGPFVLMPIAATMTMAVFSLYGSPRHRRVVLVAAVLTVLLPFVAELVPGIAPAYSFDGVNVVLHPRALALPRIVTTIGLVYTTLGYTLLPSLFLARLRDALRVSEDRVFLQAWTLKQLFASAGASRKSDAPKKPSA